MHLALHISQLKEYDLQVHATEEYGISAITCVWQLVCDVMASLKPQIHS